MRTSQYFAPPAFAACRATSASFFLVPTSSLLSSCSAAMTRPANAGSMRPPSPAPVNFRKSLLSTICSTVDCVASATDCRSWRIARAADT
jgi:hypothetical protein